MARGKQGASLVDHVEIAKNAFNILKGRSGSSSDKTPPPSKLLQEIQSRYFGK